MARTEHPQCWKHPFKKTTNIYVNTLWQVILFVSLTGLRNILSTNEAHLWVHLWGHFHRFNREGTIHPECQQCHLMRWGLGPNEKGWRRKGESPADASISSLSLLSFFFFFSSSFIIFPLDYLGISQNAPHHPYFPLFPCPALPIVSPPKKKMLREGKSPICVVIQLLEHDQIPRGQFPKENEPFLTPTASSRHLLWRATLQYH